jgi:hypothetical protein
MTLFPRHRSGSFKDMSNPAPQPATTYDEACEHVAMNFKATNGLVSGGSYMVSIDGGPARELHFRMGDSGIVRTI